MLHQNLIQVDIDSAQASGLGVTADRINVAAKHCETQNERGNDHQSDKNDGGQRNAQEIAVPNEQEGLIEDRDGHAASVDEGQAASHARHPQGHHKGLYIAEGDP